MGWLPARGTPRLDDHAMMRTFRLSLYFVLGLFLGGYSVFSHAFKAPVTPGAGISGSAGIGYKTDGYQAFANGKTMGTLEGSVSGKSFSFAAQYPLSTAAAGFLLTFVKASPAAFAVGVVATWLANYGLSVNNGALVKSVGGVPDLDHMPTLSEMLPIGKTVTYIGWTYKSFPSTPHCGAAEPASPWQWYGGYQPTGDAGCAFAVVYTKPGVPQVGYAEPTEEDLAAAKAAALPDAVASEATNKGAKLPLSKPEIETAPKVIPIGDPVTDPKTGVRTRDTIKVTPQPSTPETVEVTPYKQPVKADGTPETDPTTGEEETPAEETDHCKLNPDTIGCSKWGEPEDADLDTDTKNATINPDSGWGATTAACPADLTHTLKTGQTVGFKWKPLCDGATMFRPVVIGMAWLTATLIFMGIARKGQA